MRLRRASIFWVRSSVQTAARDDVEVIPCHQQQEQRNRKRNADRERLDGALGAALVANQKPKCRPEAQHDHDQQGNHEISHLERLSSGHGPTAYPWNACDGPYPTLKG